jgi:molybdopterin-binding protein
MKHGARNQIAGKVTSVKRGDVMSLIKFSVTTPTEMASVITTESVEALSLKVGDEVQLIVKAIHVLPVKPQRVVNFQGTNFDGIVKSCHFCETCPRRHKSANGNPENSNPMKILDSCLCRNDKNFLFRLFVRPSTFILCFITRKDERNDLLR